MKTTDRFSYLTALDLYRIINEGTDRMIAEVKDFRTVLTIAQDQFISIAIKSQVGDWSADYFNILEIRDTPTSAGMICLVILQSIEELRFLAVDIQLMTEVRFNKYLALDGLLLDGVKLERLEMAM